MISATQGRRCKSRDISILNNEYKIWLYYYSYIYSYIYNITLFLLINSVISHTICHQTIIWKFISVVNINLYTVYISR